MQSYGVYEYNDNWNKINDYDFKKILFNCVVEKCRYHLSSTYFSSEGYHSVDEVHQQILEHWTSDDASSNKIIVLTPYHNVYIR